MDLGAILVGLAILLFTGAYVLRPLVDRSSAGYAQANGRLSKLQAERDRILDSLREIDMDRTMGKLLAADYQAQRGALAARGAAVLRQIDELGALTPLPDSGEPSGLEAELEAAVTRLRLPEAALEGSHRFCTKCGVEVIPGDRFCANCGEPVGASESEG